MCHCPLGQGLEHCPSPCLLVSGTRPEAGSEVWVRKVASSLPTEGSWRGCGSDLWAGVFQVPRSLASLSFLCSFSRCTLSFSAPSWSVRLYCSFCSFFKMTRMTLVHTLDKFQMCISSYLTCTSLLLSSMFLLIIREGLMKGDFNRKM